MYELVINIPTHTIFCPKKSIGIKMIECTISLLKIFNGHTMVFFIVPKPIYVAHKHFISPIGIKKAPKIFPYINLRGPAPVWGVVNQPNGRPNFITFWKLGTYFNVNSFFCSIKVNFLQGVNPSSGIVKLPYGICTLYFFLSVF